MAKTRAQQAAIAISMKKAGKKPKSLPKAQKGTIVKDSTYKNSDLDRIRDLDKIGPLYREQYKKLTKPAPKEKKQMPMAKKGGSTPAWTRSEGKSKTGGLNAKGVASYRAANPGSKLKMAVTTKPSKLDPDSKDAKRRRSFCSRMSGVKGPMKDEKGRPTRKALSLRKWNC
jgi:hypothetical protein